MPNEKTPPEPDQPAVPDIQFTLNKDGDPIDETGERIPLVLSDIPCAACEQYGRCIKAEHCLGPVAPEPEGRPGADLHYGFKAETGKPTQPIGESYLPGGGGIFRLRTELSRANMVLHDANDQATTAEILIKQGRDIIAAALASSSEAETVLSQINEALDVTKHAGALLLQGQIEIRTYRVHISGPQFPQ